MRKKLKPVVVIAFFLFFTGLILLTRALAINSKKSVDSTTTNTPTSVSLKKEPTYTASSSQISNALEMKPIIDVSGWQLPAEIDYDTLSKNVSGVIVRVQGGSNTKEDNSADKHGIDKSYKTHIEEFQARNVPVAVYAYVRGKNIKQMEEEAESFYKASYKYKPTFYWLDVEEKTMDDMNGGVEAFRKKLKDLGAKNVGIYVGTYFMEEHSIKTDKFDSVWIPTYGSNSGYYDAAPATDLDYDLHQYTSRGALQGFAHHLDLNLITTLKDPNQVYKKLFTIEK